MGKFALGVAGLLFISIVGVAEAQPKLQTKLPSQVKEVRATKPAEKKMAKQTKKPVKTLAIVPAPLPDLSDSGLSSFDDKFISKTVHFAASTAPVPEDYNCDGAEEEIQMRKAESEALAKCEARGEEHCRLHQIKIVKAGELRCQDIPGRDCSEPKFYRGCVAQAIVVAGEEPEAQAGIF